MSIVYIIEAIMKIIVKGFVLHKNSYLRDPWNVLDLIIVISSYYFISSIIFIFYIELSNYFLLCSHIKEPQEDS